MVDEDEDDFAESFWRGRRPASIAEMDAMYGVPDKVPGLVLKLVFSQPPPDEDAK